MGSIMQYLWEASPGLLDKARAVLSTLPDGDPLRGLIAELADTAEGFRGLIDNGVQAMYSGDLEGRIVSGNQALAAMLGYESVESMLPIESFALQHYMDPSERTGLVGELRAKGRVVNREVRLKRVDGTPVWGLANIRLFRDKDGVERIDGVTVDITARKQAEEALAASERRHRRILATAGEGFVFMDQGLAIRQVNEAFCRMVGRPREEILGKKMADFASDVFREYMLRNRDRLLAMEYRTFDGELMHSSGRTVPVLVHGHTMRCEDGAAAGNVAFVTDMTESRKALALAAEVQRSLLPSRAPDIDGLEVAGRSDPCQYAGGDYFDYIEPAQSSGQGMRVVVGDVTGHGLDAALLMTMARGVLRMRSAQAGTIAEVVGDLNRHLARDTSGSGRFMTLFLLEIGPGGELGWVRAGHDPALVYDPVRDEFSELGGKGVALGVLPDASFEYSRSPALAPGQVLAVGTDGIWEARNPSGEMFGKKRFRQAVRRSAARGATAVVDAVFNDLREFAGLALEDDATLVVLTAKASPPM